MDSGSYVVDPRVKPSIEPKGGNISNVTYDFEKAYLARMFKAKLVEVMRGSHKAGERVNILLFGRGHKFGEIRNPLKGEYYIVFLLQDSLNKIPNVPI